MADEIKIWNYGEYSTANYGSSRAVKVGSLTLYFSYKTVVAFCDGGSLTVHENDWGTTTGKHLNWIDGRNKKARLTAGDFDAKLKEALARHNLTVE